MCDHWEVFLCDIHGEYEQFMTILGKINFGEKDTLYVLGDVVDRGPEPIKVLRYMMTKIRRIF